MQYRQGIIVFEAVVAEAVVTHLVALFIVERFFCLLKIFLSSISIVYKNTLLLRSALTFYLSISTEVTPLRSAHYQLLTPQ